MLRLVQIKWLILLGLLTLISCQRKVEVVATVGDTTISRTELVDFLKAKYRLDTLASLKHPQKMNTLNQMIERRLKYLAAVDSGFTNDDIILAKAKNKADAYLHAQITDDEIRDSLMSESAKKKLYQDLQELVKVRNILIQYKGALRAKAQRSEEDAFKIADSLKSIIGKKGSFSFIAHKHSEGMYAEHGGAMGYVTRAAVDEVLVDPIFNAPMNQIIGPIKTKYGIHLLQVEDRKKNHQLKPYSEMEQLLEQYIKEQNMILIKKILKKQGDALLANYSYQMNVEGQEKFIRILNEWAAQPPLIVDTLFLKCRDILLMNSGSFKLSAGDFIFSVNDFSKVFSQFNTKERLEKFLRNSQNYYVWVQEAEKQGYADKNDFKLLKERLIENLVVFKLETIWRMQVQITPETVKEYYQNNKSNFKSEKDGKVKGLNEVRSQIERQLLSEGIDNLNAQMIEKIKQKYPVTIYEDIVRAIR